MKRSITALQRSRMDGVYPSGFIGTASPGFAFEIWGVNEEDVSACSNHSVRIELWKYFFHCDRIALCKPAECIYFIDAILTASPGVGQDVSVVLCRFLGLELFRDLLFRFCNAKLAFRQLCEFSHN